MSDLKINISRLSEGLHAFPLETEPGAIGLDERFGVPVRVRAAVEKTSRQLVLAAEISTEGNFICDRCLERFSLPMSAAFTVAYLQEQRAGAVAGEAAEEPEVHVISPETNMIDIGEDVRQYLLLAVPVKLLCSEECRGLCPHCGANLNRQQCSCTQDEVDPRWSALKKLSEN